MTYLNISHKTKEQKKNISIWQISETYLRVQKNNIRIQLYLHLSQKLLSNNNKANRDKYSLAIILHYLGWYYIDTDQITSEGIHTKNYLKSDLRYLNEKEGVGLYEILLKANNWQKEILIKIRKIINGQYTRPNLKSLNDRIVKEAIKLLIYTITGISLITDWVGIKHFESDKRLKSQKSRFETKIGHEFAPKKLEFSKNYIMPNII